MRATSTTKEYKEAQDHFEEICKQKQITDDEKSKIRNYYFLYAAKQVECREGDFFESIEDYLK